MSADYAGDVTKAVSGTLVYTAVFSGKPAQFTGADALADTAAGHGNLTWLLILPFAAAAAGLVFLGRFLYQKLKEKTAALPGTKIAEFQGLRAVPDPPCGLISIHIGHPYIRKNRVVISFW